jgi:hypothetical protein
VAEWLKAPVLKTGRRASVSRVRIPPRPPITERVVPLRLDHLEHLEHLKRKAARWATDNADALRQADPQMPATLHSRMADNWRPLFAIADLAGGSWGRRARCIAEKLSAERTEDTASVMLLEDIRAYFEELNREEYPSADLVAWLADREERPWCEWKAGRPLTARQVARLLEPFGISPKQLWVGRNVRGYEKKQFADAFTRYLGDGGGQTASPLDPNETVSFDSDDPLDRDLVLADTGTKTPMISGHSSALADQNPEGDHVGGGDPFASLKDHSFKLKDN